jgi:hypothetical protein
MAVQAIAGTHLADALRLWLSLRTGDAPPMRRDLVPEIIPPHLFPWLALAQKEPSGRWFGRLAGAQIIGLAGLETRQRYFDEYLPPDAIAKWEIAAGTALRNRLPTVSVGPMGVPGREFLTVRVIFLPFIGAEGQCDHVLCATAWTDEPHTGAIERRAFTEAQLAGFAPAT